MYHTYTYILHTYMHTYIHTYMHSSVLYKVPANECLVPVPGWQANMSPVFRDKTGHECHVFTPSMYIAF